MKTPGKLSMFMNWVAIAFAGSLVVVTFIFSYMVLSPVDVLTDWKVSVENKTYHPTDDIYLNVEYKKIRPVSGDTYYYLECENPSRGLVRYPISIVEANRPEGSGVVQQPLRIPPTIPDLPRQCRIAISVEYIIYTFRSFAENNQTNWFTVDEVRPLQ